MSIEKWPGKGQTRPRNTRDPESRLRAGQQKKRTMAAGRPALARAARTLRSPTLTCYDRRRKVLGLDKGHRRRCAELLGSRRLFCPILFLVRVSDIARVTRRFCCSPRWRKSRVEELEASDSFLPSLSLLPPLSHTPLILIVRLIQASSSLPPSPCGRSPSPPAISQSSA